jgi:P4 family phage/plasmid primase-like protien
MSVQSAEALIKRGLEMILCPGQVVELRALGVPMDNGLRTVNGFYDDVDMLAEAAAHLSKQGARGVYFTPNPLRKTISASQRNSIGVARRGTAASDTDVEEIRWLLIDVDPSRPVNTSSNQTEKDNALSIIGKIRAFLEAQGWPAPLFGDSGNGYHLMYRTEGLTAALHRDILEYLSFRFSKDAVAVVDQSVHNPSRIWKVYGTLSRKGENNEERPWRVAHLISKSSSEKVVQQQQLQDLLADSPKENKRDVLPKEERERLTTWMGTHFPSAGSFVPWQDKGRKWVFDVCPWNPAHTDRSAYVLQFNSGAVVAGCLHKNCKGHQKDEDGNTLGWDSLQELAGERFGGGGDDDPHGPLTPSSSGNFNLTDLGNAKRLIYAFGTSIRYSSSHNAWYLFDDTRWRVDTNGAIQRCAKSAVGLIFSEANAETDRQRQRAIQRHALRSESHRALNALVSVASTEAEVCIAADRLDANPWLFNLANGTLDLRTGKVSDHDRTDLITKISPVKWNVDARCPLWDEFILYAMEEDEEVVEFLHRFFGYCLTGLVTEQVLLFMEGTGGNGKTTALLVLMHILGDYAIQGAPGLLMSKHNESHPTEVADLEGARFVANAEVEKGKPFAEALIKQLTGSDPIRARRMRQDFYQFMPSHKLCIAANHRPIIKGNDEGIWRRVIRIPWRRKVSASKKDPFLIEKLKNEAPGILNRLVAGCLAWQEQGLEPPQKVRLATDEYREEMDVLSEYMDDRCSLHESASIPRKQLYLDYAEWCEEMKQRPQSYSLFCRQLSERDFKSTVAKVKINGKRKSVRVWRGITLQRFEVRPTSPAERISEKLGWGEA